VAAYEAGGGARPPTVRKLAEALGIEVTDLMEDTTSPKGASHSSLEPSFNDVLDEERRSEHEAALAVLYRGLARRARLVVERARRDGPSPELGAEASALHAEAAAVARLRGRGDIRGIGSEELAAAEEAHLEAERAIQAMIRQDVEASPEEREEVRKFRPSAPQLERENTSETTGRG